MKHFLLQKFLLYGLCLVKTGVNVRSNPVHLVPNRKCPLQALYKTNKKHIQTIYIQKYKVSSLQPQIDKNRLKLYNI